MSSKEFKLNLQQELLSLPVAKQSNTDPTQLIIRCPICGDSVKDYTHGHFYIKLDVDNDDVPVLYNCFRCKSAGIFNKQLLHDLDIHDLKMASSLGRYNKKNESILMKKIGYNFDKLKYKISPYHKSYDRKLKYISDRLGIPIGENDIEKYKIVPSLKDFLIYNKIEEVNCYTNIAQGIEKNYVGFLSTKNNFILFRDITGTEKYRHIKYKIHKNNMNNMTFYTVPTKLDVLSKDTINIHIAEGVYDILGVYNHLIDDKTNSIFISVTSGDYKSPLQYFLRLGIVGNVDIHIYADSDGTSKLQYFKTKLLPVIKNWVRHVYVYYNTIGKDYGVTKEEIDISVNKLK